MANLFVEYLAVSELKPDSRNARLHSQKQVHQIAASIREFGFNIPVLTDIGNVIIAGHGRVQAARTLGMESVPVLRIEHLTDAQKRAFALADNKIALNADWDLDILQRNMRELSELDLNFDVALALGAFLVVVSVAVLLTVKLLPSWTRFTLISLAPSARFDSS